MNDHQRSASARDRHEAGRAALSRREFLASTAACAWLACHPEPILSDTASPPGGRPLITRLQLSSAAPLAAMRGFYRDTLGLEILEDRADRLTVAAGLTPITFEPAAGSAGAPWYHVAFNIPENKLLAARAWQLQRTPLIPTPAHRIDPSFPPDVRHFPSWNAHSVFFWDPAGNLLEHIARHDLGNARPGPFTSRDILYASEIGFVFDDQHGAAREVHRDLGLPAYPPGRDPGGWWAMGNELGLVLCLPKRIWGENTDRPKRFGVHPTRATIRAAAGGGAGRRSYEFPGYPYLLEVEPDG